VTRALLVLDPQSILCCQSLFGEHDLAMLTRVLALGSQSSFLPAYRPFQFSINTPHRGMSPLIERIELRCCQFQQMLKSNFNLCIHLQALFAVNHIHSAIDASAA